MKRMNPLFRSLLVAFALTGAAGTAGAKLPVAEATPEAKAKAEEAAAKAAAAAKKDAEDLGRYQDKAAANFKERQPK
jgi:hypothetical protein